MKVLVTGVAGFIGYHVAKALLDRQIEVVGLDNLTPYYDIRLKSARLHRLISDTRCIGITADISDPRVVADLVEAHSDITHVVHLAAQAGVRYSLVDPYSYVESNVMGQVTLLEAARSMNRLEHFVYASSSSVYGRDAKVPFREDARTDEPASLYAASKRAAELISSSYAHLFALPLTGLRFFTVYGPWGRPDMAYWKFAEAIISGQPVVLYDEGALRRDFTYVDDIVRGVLAVLGKPPMAGTSRVLNIGNHLSERVDQLVGYLEAGLGRKAIRRTAPRPSADVVETFASIEALTALTGFASVTRLEQGIAHFLDWFIPWRLENGPAALALGA